MKRKLGKLKNNICIWIYDLFTPFDTILATICLMFILPITLMYFGNESSKAVNDNIIVGVISSSIVAIVVETQNNLKFNTRRHSELLDYFLELTILKLALDRVRKENVEVDNIKVVWRHLPSIIRVLKEVNERKVEWLSCAEARTVQNILIIYEEICLELRTYLENEIKSYKNDDLYKEDYFRKGYKNLPEVIEKELERQSRIDDLDELVYSLFFKGRYLDYKLRNKVYVISDYYIGEPSNIDVEKNLLSELCLELLDAIKELFPYLNYEHIFLNMMEVKSPKKQ